MKVPSVGHFRFCSTAARAKTKTTKSSNERTRFTIKSTHEKSWVTVAKKNETAEGGTNKVTWARHGCLRGLGQAI